EQERLGYEAALRLQEQLDEEESYTLQQLRGYSFNEIKSLFEATIKRVNTFTPIESDVDRTVPKIAAGSTKRAKIQECTGKSFGLKHIHDITWRLYDTCGVHHVSTKDGVDIYMLVEREYPLSRGVLTQMLVAKLLVEQDNEMSRELLRKIFMQVERPRNQEDKSVWKNPLREQGF
ncbi:hypothetical protein Tco_0649980, partial [Tanacetum coccineum]